MRFVPSPETFEVEEVALYEPAGEGTHTFLWVEKRDLTTPEAARRLAAALGLPARDVGFAGLKDRHATTRQWLSVPGIDPAAALDVQTDGVKVLDARRHHHKLRTGHLRSNGFRVVLEAASPEEGRVVESCLERLGRQGLPNRFGGQRFGAGGDNADRGLALLRGQTRERDSRKRRLLWSAAQSVVFNRVLDLRGAPPGLRAVREGDVLQKTDTGGLFVCTDPAVDQARVDAGAVIPTGPLPGSRVMEPPEGTPARALEDSALRDVGATREDLVRAGRKLPGTRRPVVVPVMLSTPPAERVGESLVLRFALPAGSYATVLVETLLAEAGARTVC